MFTRKGLGPYGGEGFLAEGSSRHAEQDDKKRNDNSRYLTDSLDTSDA